MENNKENQKGWSHQTTLEGRLKSSLMELSKEELVNKYMESLNVINEFLKKQIEEIIK